MDAPIRLVVIERHASVGEALARAFVGAGMNVVGVADTGTAGIEACERVEPDVVLLEADLPDVDGAVVASAIRARVPSARTIVLTSSADAARVGPALAAGVMGYVLKTSTLDEVLDTVRRVAAGERVLCAEAAAVGRLRSSGAVAFGLTPRERDVLGLLAAGLTTREMAARLGLSEKTIETHRSRMYAKLSAGSAPMAVRVAIRARLVEP